VRVMDAFEAPGSPVPAKRRRTGELPTDELPTDKRLRRLAQRTRRARTAGAGEDAEQDEPQQELTPRAAAKAATLQRRNASQQSRRAKAADAKAAARATVLATATAAIVGATAAADTTIVGANTAIVAPSAPPDPRALTAEAEAFVREIWTQFAQTNALPASLERECASLCFFRRDFWKVHVIPWLLYSPRFFSLCLGEDAAHCAAAHKQLLMLLVQKNFIKAGCLVDSIVRENGLWAGRSESL